MKLKTFAISIFFLFAIGTASSGKELFREDAKLETDREMDLTESVVPVEAGKKHLVLFRARAGGDYTIGANARIRIMNLRYAGARLRVRFFDEEGTRLSDMEIPVITGDFHDYARVFYPPSKTVAFKLYLVPYKGSALALDGISVTAGPEGEETECVNVHPVFTYGDWNFYGYSSGYGGRFYTRPDGKTVWNSGFLGYSPSFPVQGGAFYDIRCRGVKYRGRKSYIYLDCYRPNDTRAFKSMRAGISKDGANTKLQIPNEVTSAKLRCYYVIMEEIKVAEHKYEKK